MADHKKEAITQKVGGRVEVIFRRFLIKGSLEITSIFNEFPGAFVHGFWYHFRSKIAPTWSSKLKQKMFRCRNTFFIDLLSILASILEPIFLQNLSKWGDRVKGTHYFLHLRFLSPLWGTPWLRFPRFSIPLGKVFGQFWGRFLKQFSMFFLWFVT